MRIRFVAVALLAAGCRTGGDDASSAKSIPPGALGLPAPTQLPLLAEVTGLAAQTIYDTLKLDVQTDSLGTSKGHTGELAFYCNRIGSGGTIPAGAQGIVAPAQYGCSMTVPFNFPPGAQGLPPQPFLQVDGDAARALYVSFNAPEKNGAAGTWSKSFKGDGKVVCGFASATPSEYRCEVRGKSTVEPDPVPTGGVSVTLAGADAKTFYELLKLPVNNAVGGGNKRRKGPTALVCKKKGVGGQIPPGAQGIAAPATYDCTINTVPTIPTGAQGLPGPAKLLATFKTASLGAKFYNGLDSTPTQAQGVATKKYSGDVAIDCSYALVSGGQKKYTCNVASSSGGIPPGAQGLPQPQGG